MKPLMRACWYGFSRLPLFQQRRRSDASASTMIATCLNRIPPRKSPQTRIGQVGERGAEVRLLEHQQHRNADQREGLADVRPCQFPAGQPPEVAGDDDDEDQLDPLGGLKVAPRRKLDPAARPENLGPDQLAPRSATEY